MIPHNHDPLTFSSFVHDKEQHMITTDPNTASTYNNTSKRKRNLPGHPDPNAEVISLSPKSLMATNRFFCEICNKGFQREQNLQLHRRGHNLPWKLKQRTSKEDQLIIKKKVYVCPDKSCLHNDPARALGDLTGIKKHYSRKHGEKNLKCDKCCKKYAVVSDLKAHSKICGTKDFICDCGTLFSRKDSFITHRAFCDALTHETTKLISLVPSHLDADATNNPILMQSQLDQTTLLGHNFTGPDQTMLQSPSCTSDPVHNLWKLQGEGSHKFLLNESLCNKHKNQEDVIINNGLNQTGQNMTSPFLKRHEEMNLASVMSATTLLQKAAQMGSSSSSSDTRSMFGLVTSSSSFNNVMPRGSNCFKKTSKEEELTKDFLGVGSKDVDQQRLYHDCE
ncbi:unnamed protein product [Cochlearia groenlandica]